MKYVVHDGCIGCGIVEVKAQAFSRLLISGAYHPVAFGKVGFRVSRILRVVASVLR